MDGERHYRRPVDGGSAGGWRAAQKFDLHRKDNLVAIWILGDLHAAKKTIYVELLHFHQCKFEQRNFTKIKFEGVKGCCTIILTKKEDATIRAFKLQQCQQYHQSIQLHLYKQKIALNLRWKTKWYNICNINHRSDQKSNTWW